MRTRICLAMLAGFLAAACNAPQQLILAGEADLPLASGDKVAPCPAAAPGSACVTTSASDPTEPYMHALTAKGWLPAHDADQPLLLRWISPYRDGVATRCIVMAPPIDAEPGKPGLMQFTVFPQGSADNLACERPS